MDLSQRTQILVSTTWTKARTAFDWIVYTGLKLEGMTPYHWATRMHECDDVPNFHMPWSRWKDSFGDYGQSGEKDPLIDCANFVEKTHWCLLSSTWKRFISWFHKLWWKDLFGSSGTPNWFARGEGIQKCFTSKKTAKSRTEWERELLRMDLSGYWFNKPSVHAAFLDISKNSFFCLLHNRKV